MLRKQENYNELQLLKQQVKELSEEVNNLKISLKSDGYKSYNDHIIGKAVGKTIGNMIFKSNNNGAYNQQLLNQVSKIFSYSMNAPNSFGENK